MEAAAAAAAADLQAPLVQDNNRPGTRFPLSYEALLAFVTKAADSGVMGLLTLNIFSATFFLAWGREGSRCIPKAKEPTSSLFSFIPVLSSAKVVIATLPFIMYPITVYINGLAKAAEHGRNHLGCVAALCLLELLYVLVLGGIMTFCIFEELTGYMVLAVTSVMCILAVGIWAGCIYRPKWLRCWCCYCFRGQAPPADGVPPAANPVVPVLLPPAPSAPPAPAPTAPPAPPSAHDDQAAGPNDQV